MAWVFVAVFMGVLTPIAWYVGKRLRESRLAAMRAWAERTGLRYGPDDGSWLGFSTQAFGSVMAPEVPYVLSGQVAAWQAVVFEYHYRRPVSKSSHVIYSVVAVRLPRPVAFVEVVPRTLAMDLLSRLTGDDASAAFPALSGRYRVRTADVAGARQVLNPQVTQWLGSAPGPGPSFLAVEHWLVVWRRGTLLRPLTAQDLLQWGTWLAGQVPAEPLSR